MSGPLRSRRWFEGDDDIALEHRAAAKAAGLDVRNAGDRPIIGVLSSINDLNPCNLPLRDLIPAVRQGIWRAGGIAVEIPVLSLGEDLVKPTAMLYRNLLAIEVEEAVRAHPLDGVVLLGGCDKTIPGQLMGAASADIPAVQIAAGYRRPGVFRGTEVAAGTDLWRYWDQRRAGRLSDRDWHDLETALGCGQGVCNVMGTAMTVAILSEVLGMSLPGSATLAAHDSRALIAASAAGGRAVELVRAGITAGAVLTRAAFGNAALALAAIGGSTNAVIHLCAIAGRRGIRLPLEAFDEASRRVPVLADIAPVGRHSIAAFDSAGGVPALLRQIADLLDHGVTTVAGTLADAIGPDPEPGGAIREIGDPVAAPGGLAVLRGSLAPDGALFKAAAADPRLLRHTGPAVVFDGYADMLRRIDRPGLAAPDTVLVLRGCGPRGGDGFPEWGMLPIPKPLAAEGVEDMVRLSDARMSGTSYGTCILHVAPDSSSGGPLALVRDGDLISLDIAARRLDLLLDPAELERRRAEWRPPAPRHRRGWPALFDEHVLQAPEGADLDFLVARTQEQLVPDEPTIGRS